MNKLNWANFSLILSNHQSKTTAPWGPKFNNEISTGWSYIYETADMDGKEKFLIYHLKGILILYTFWRVNQYMLKTEKPRIWTGCVFPENKEKSERLLADFQPVLKLMFIGSYFYLSLCKKCPWSYR